MRRIKLSLLLLAAVTIGIGVACVTAAPGGQGLVDSTPVLSILNANYKDATVYAAPCGDAACAVLIGRAGGNSTARVPLRRQVVSADGTLTVLVRLFPGGESIVLPSVQLSREQGAVVSLMPQLTTSYVVPK